MSRYEGSWVGVYPVVFATMTPEMFLVGSTAADLG